jgi:hypothetical protein
MGAGSSIEKAHSKIHAHADSEWSNTLFQFYNRRPHRGESRRSIDTNLRAPSWGNLDGEFGSFAFFAANGA